MFDIIVACTEEGGFGKCGGIPWHIPEDMQRFSSTTRGNTVIMGRKTWESLPRKPLPDRINIVVTQQESVMNDQSESVYTCKTLPDALQLAKRQYPQRRIYVIGGERLYQEAIRHHQCDKVILTKIYNTIECDRFFPLSEIHKKYRRVYTSYMRMAEPYMYRFCEFQRLKR